MTAQPVPEPNLNGHLITFLRDELTDGEVRDIAPKLAPIRLGRADDGSSPVMDGHFSVFNNWYEIDSWEGHFLERTTPGAFKQAFNAWRSADDPQRIPVLLEHGYDPQVGDKPLGTPVVLEEDNVGARYEVQLFNEASYVRDLLPALEAGSYGSSFRFRVTQDEWDEEPGRSIHNPRGIPERTIKEVMLFEFGPTVFPANPAATAGVRSATGEFYRRLHTREPEKVERLLARHSEIRTPKPPAGEAPVVSLDSEGVEVMASALKEMLRRHDERTLDTGGAGAANPEDSDPPAGNQRPPVHIRESEWKYKIKETVQ